jgi:phage shock protein A
MSEFSFAPEVADEAQADHQHENRAGEPGTLALSADEFSSLEDRILRAVNLVKRERMARAAAEERAALAESRAGENGSQVEQLEKEVQALRAERDQVKQRVERLLSQLDALEL